MPTEKVGAWSIHHSRRQQHAAAFVDKTQHAFIIVHLSRDQDIEIIRQADQAAIKHPVRGSGQCDAIVEDIRATILHRPDMSGINLRTSASIDEF